VTVARGSPLGRCMTRRRRAFWPSSKINATPSEQQSPDQPLPSIMLSAQCMFLSPGQRMSQLAKDSNLLPVMIPILIQSLIGHLRQLHRLQLRLEIATHSERRPGLVSRHQREKEIVRTSHYQARSLALHSMNK